MEERDQWARENVLVLIIRTALQTVRYKTPSRLSYEIWRHLIRATIVTLDGQEEMLRGKTWHKGNALGRTGQPSARCAQNLLKHSLYAIRCVSGRLRQRLSSSPGPKDRTIYAPLRLRFQAFSPTAPNPIPSKVSVAGSGTHTAVMSPICPLSVYDTEPSGEVMVASIQPVVGFRLPSSLLRMHQWRLHWQSGPWT